VNATITIIAAEDRGDIPTMPDGREASDRAGVGVFIIVSDLFKSGAMLADARSRGKCRVVK